MRPIEPAIEDDVQYFELRRQATSRVRMPFPGELLTMRAPVIVPPGHAAVIIVVVRRKSGKVIRARSVAIAPCSQALQ